MLGFIKWASLALMLPILGILFWYKHLRIHPFNIVSYLILFDSINIYYILLDRNICMTDSTMNQASQRWMNLWPADLGPAGSPQRAETILILVDYSMEFTIQFTFFVSSLISIGFAYDLIQTIRNPFQRYEVRTQKMTYAIVVLATLYATYLIVLGVNYRDSIQKKEFNS